MRKSCPLWLFIVTIASFAQAQSAHSSESELQGSVDRIAQQVLATTKVPSASIAIVKDGRIAYVKAYGDAKLDPRTPATPEMSYSIGSISKQFTATAILMLAEQSKLSLDDHVSKFLPALTRAHEVTIRQLLSHTSGYQDYWPQDYVPPFMLREVTAIEILDRWARKPLDFEPGTRWEYSNTNFVIAGLIIEKASGMPFLKFMGEKVFSPLGMQHIVDVDQGRLADPDPTGYMRYALGPPRVAPKEGKGWLFAAGELAMPPQQLAKWDIAMLEKKLLKPSSYKEMRTEIKLKNGQGTRYALGIGVQTESGHRVLNHGGEVSGFVSRNMIFPDDNAAIVVLTNQDASSAAEQIAEKIMPLLFAEQGNPPTEQTRDRAIFDRLQDGKISRTQFTDNGNSYFSDQAISDYASSLSPLGTPEDFTLVEKEGRGGMTFKKYIAKFQQKTISITIYEMPDGKIEQYLIAAQN